MSWTQSVNHSLPTSGLFIPSFRKHFGGLVIPGPVPGAGTRLAKGTAQCLLSWSSHPSGWRRINRTCDMSGMVRAVEEQSRRGQGIAGASGKPNSAAEIASAKALG